MGACTIQCPLYQMTERVEKNKRIIEDQNTGFTYASGDTDDILRRKCAALLFSSSTIGLPIRLTTRVLFLVTGMWIYSGYDKAQAVWTKKCYDWNTQDRANPAPENHEYYIILAKEIGSELVDQVIKCATLPLAFVAMTFAAFWGLIVPLDGRGLFSDIERVWSITTPQWMSDRTIIVYANFMATCMQPKEVHKKLNLFRFMPGYDPHAPASLMGELWRLQKDGFVVLTDDAAKAWNEALLKQDFNQTAKLQELVDACHELNTVISTFASQAAIEAAEQRKQAALADFEAIL